MATFHFFKQNTDATATNAGFAYQHVLTLLAWLQLDPNNLSTCVYCEYEDDIFTQDPHNGLNKFTQVKCYSNPLGISHKNVYGSLLHFYHLFISYSSNANNLFYFQSNTIVEGDLASWDTMTVYQKAALLRPKFLSELDAKLQDFSTRTRNRPSADDIQRAEQLAAGLRFQWSLLGHLENFVERIHFIFGNNLDTRQVLESYLYEIWARLSADSSWGKYLRSGVEPSVIASYLIGEIELRSSNKNVEDRRLTADLLVNLLEKFNPKPIENRLSEIENFINQFYKDKINVKNAAILKFFERQKAEYNQPIFNEHNLSDIYVQQTISIYRNCFIETPVTPEFIETNIFAKDLVEAFVKNTLAEISDVKPEFADARILLIFGQPGQGKSSLTKYIAHTYTQISLPQNNVGNVFWIRLRDIGKLDLDNIWDSICAHINKLARGKKYKGNSTDELFSYADISEGLIILDGLDELQILNQSKDQFNNFVDKLVDLIDENELENTQFIVTSRYGYTKPDYEKNVLTIALNDFNEQQQLEFIGKFPNSNLSEEDLLSFKNNSFEIAHLVQQPILLYFLVANDFKANWSNIQNKAQIYQELFEKITANAWDKRKEWQDERGENLVKKEEIPLFLEEIAFAIFKSGKEYITNDEIKALEQMPPSIQKLFDNKQDGFVKFFMMAFYAQKSELEENNYAVEFLHKSFMEFLTAKKIVRFCQNQNIISWENICSTFEKVFNCQILSKEILDFLNRLFSNENKSSFMDKVRNFFPDYILNEIKYCDDKILNDTIFVNFCCFFLFIEENKTKIMLKLNLSIFNCFFKIESIYYLVFKRFYLKNVVFENICSSWKNASMKYFRIIESYLRDSYFFNNSIKNFSFFNTNFIIKSKSLCLFENSHFVEGSIAQCIFYSPEKVLFLKTSFEKVVLSKNAFLNTNFYSIIFDFATPHNGYTASFFYNLFENCIFQSCRLSSLLIEGNHYRKSKWSKSGFFDIIFLEEEFDSFEIEYCFFNRVKFTGCKFTSNVFFKECSFLKVTFQNCEIDFSLKEYLEEQGCSFLPNNGYSPSSNRIFFNDTPPDLSLLSKLKRPRITQHLFSKKRRRPPTK